MNDSIFTQHYLRSTKRLFYVGVIALLFLHSEPLSGAIWHVSTAGSDANTGNSWAQSFLTLQHALGAATSGDEIWVAAGTYKPAVSARNIAFQIPSGVKVYGGFAGNELNLAERDLDLIYTTNATILSGDLNSNDSGFSNQSENSYRVVIFQNASSATELDGFTISGAYNNQGNIQAGYGGGIYNNGSGSGNSSNPHIRNCKFEYNSAFIGGGIYNDGISGGNSNPVIENCIFISNQSFDSGAAMANYGTSGNSSPSILSCFFIGNTAGFNSGALNNHGFSGNSSPIITNSVFMGNFASFNGGVMVNTASSGGTSNPIITNCSFSGNRAGNVGGVIRNLEANVQILNSIIWGNSSNFNNDGGTVTVTYSVVEGGVPGTGNLNVDPQFITQPNFNSAPTTIGDLQLNITSPAIDAGTNSGAPSSDILGNIRPSPGTITDMGAFENTPSLTCFADTDGDGFGNPAVSQQFSGSCGAGFVTDNTDCNDNNLLEFPGQTWYADIDNDGYSSGTILNQCLRPAGYKAASELITTSGDCNDNNSAINPASTEICNGIDDNCNDMVDDVLNFETWYEDTDGDGFGNPDASVLTCDGAPMGYVGNADDCDDTDSAINPNTVWYKDVDGDGYSDGMTNTQCERPTDYYLATDLTATSGDCDDENGAVNPGATEICNGIDDNCSDTVDDGLDFEMWYEDSDGDGFGNPDASVSTCDGAPMGYVGNADDCDDTETAINPNTVWYKDADGDGYSDGMSITQCERPTDYYLATDLTATSGDCDDENGAVNPGATEICNGIDDNCSDTVDDGLDFEIWYEDSDGDGFGNPDASVSTCDGAPMGYVGNADDCDDTDVAINPNTLWYKDIDGDGYSDGMSITQCERPTDYYLATELTALSGDCDDEDAAINPNTLWYKDVDGDGYSDGMSITQCERPTDYYLSTELTALSGDCDDEDAAINPNTLWYKDVDGDGYSDGMSITQCERPTDYYLSTELTAVVGDCDDANASINPSTLWYKDVDGDGFSDGMTITQCDRPTDYYLAPELIAISDDCDDENADVNPGAIEICNGIDDNCSEVIDDINGEDGNWINGSIGSSNGGSKFECGIYDEIIAISSTGFTQLTSDNQHFVYQNICGDFTITARVLSVTGGGWGGLQARENLSTGSKKAVIKTQLSNFIRREIRTMTNGVAQSQHLMRPQHKWLRLVRIGNVFQGFTSSNGMIWQFAYTASISMPNCLSVGLISESINNTTVTEATFDQVTWTVQSGGNFLPEDHQSLKLEPSEIKLFPNPTNGFVNISLPEHYIHEDLSMAIINSLGKIVYSSTLTGSQREQLQLEIPSGMYQVIFYPKNGEPITKRLLIQN